MAYLHVRNDLLKDGSQCCAFFFSRWIHSNLSSVDSNRLSSTNVRVRHLLDDGNDLQQVKAYLSCRPTSNLQTDYRRTGTSNTSIILQGSSKRLDAPQAAHSSDVQRQKLVFRKVRHCLQQIRTPFFHSHRTVPSTASLSLSSGATPAAAAGS